MGPVTGVVTFLLIWWVVLFTTLPLGVRAQWEEGETVEGSEPGAPVTPQLARKALITTAIAAVLWLALFFSQRAGVFDGLSR